MFYCDICDKEFKTEASYKKHLESHSHKINEKIKKYEDEIEELRKENLNYKNIIQDYEENKLDSLNEEIERLKKDNINLVISNDKLMKVKNDDNIVPILNNLKQNNEVIKNLGNTFSNLKYLITGEISIVLLIFFLKEYYPILNYT